MPSLTDEAKFWAGRASDAHHSILETVQDSAGKWQAAIAASLGVYATVGFLVGANKAASVPVHGWALAAVIASYGLTGILGVIAIILANLAAQGIPELLTGEPITGMRMRELTMNRAAKARLRLSSAIRLAAVAGLVAIATSISLLAAGVDAARNPSAILVTSTGAYCGKLIDSKGRLYLHLPSGRIFPIAQGSLTEVNACPG